MDVFNKKENNSGADYKARFAGLGNNIVFFSGGRGYGKTSAMRSFAQYLTGDISLEDKEKMKNQFIVLDSIDPSAMESGENIIRVVMSRMYHMFEKSEQTLLKEMDREKYRKKKFELFEQFQKCYESIDSIKSDKQKESIYDTDDLEKLAHLGSSAGLKECIYETVDKYLNLMKQCNKDGKGDCYLVVAIDDMDLATQKIYRICEDIRNYLSVPNIIVLFASDYDQLVYAIYQKYLRKYRVLQSNQKELIVSNECYIMTGKYLEKLLPMGHRVELPKMGDLLANKKQRIRLEYCKYDEKQDTFVERKISSAHSEECYEIQDQLLGKLYINTGIVFLRKSGVMHFILPHTLRELSHFTRMLDDMKVIDEQQGCEKKREALLNNISMFKQYFMNYWCVNHLTIKQKKLIEKIEKQNENRDNRLIMESISAYLDDWKMFYDIPEASYCAIWNIIKSKFSKEKELQEALYAYYTIFLNEWYVSAIGNHEEFEKLASFLTSKEEREMEDSSAFKTSEKSEKMTDPLISVYQLLKKDDIDAPCVRNISVNCEVQNYLRMMIKSKAMQSAKTEEDQLRIIKEEVEKFIDSLKCNKEINETDSQGSGAVVSMNKENAGESRYQNDYAYLGSSPFGVWDF